MLGPGQALLADLTAEGGKEIGEVDAGQSQSHGQQHIAQKRGPLGFRPGETEGGAHPQDQGKQHRPLPLLPPPEQIKNGESAELRPG